MDNLCHTLVGAAMGRAGLRRTTRFATATLMIAANIPDLDVLVFATDVPHLSFRRGWTHGVAAQAVLPLVLTALVVLYGRMRQPAGDGGPPLRPRWIFGLSLLGVYSHVFLDYLNNYGVRLLSPVDWRWFYGDAVFIIDPWLWLVLSAGVWLSRTRKREAPARVALVLAAAYTVVMLLSARSAAGTVYTLWTAANGTPPGRLMVGPVPVTPFARAVIVDAGDRYELGRFTWGSGVSWSAAGVPKNDDRPEVQAVRDRPEIRAFLTWSRFPAWRLEPVGGGTRVTVQDMRFGDRFSASAVVR